MAQSRFGTQALKRRASTGLNEMKKRGGTLAGLLGIAWVVEVVNLALGQSLSGLGIWPRSALGLLGVLTAPFLHTSLAHLVTNTVSFVVLGGLVMAVQGRRHFWRVSMAGAAVSGLLVWAAEASTTVTVGASGVIYAYLGYLMAWGLYRRSFFAVAGSLLSVFFFGSLLWGVVPGLAGVGVSWLGHLGGFIGGVLAARSLSPAIRRP